MKKLVIPKLAYILIYLLLTCAFETFSQEQAPFSAVADLFDQSNEVDLGLEEADNTETVTVFAPSEDTDHFSNGVVMTHFKGYFYCQWQSSQTDEDAEDTWVAYSRSEDGVTWSEPMVLAESIEDGYSSSGGWWVAGDTLIAYINTWPASVSPRGGYTRYTFSIDGMDWVEPMAVKMQNGDTLKGIFEQDPHALPDGRIINAAHFQPGIVVNPIYTDDPKGITRWVKAEFPNLTTGDVSRSIEPSWFWDEDGNVIMNFRDQTGTNFILASLSADRGENWTSPVLTNMRDSRSKQSAGNFPDGTAFLVGNPVDNTTRIPLAVTLSENGKVFNTAYVLRTGGDGLQELRYEGRAKRLGYHYPKSMIHDGYLYVSYATNKEDVEYTRVPISSLELNELINQEPIINRQAYVVDEHSSQGTEVGTVKALDPEKETLTFSITAGNEDGAFSIDAATGVITIVDATKVDYEVINRFSLTVEVSDGEKSASNEIIITVLDVEEVLALDKSIVMTLYPNPVDSYLFIRTDEELVSTHVMDINGKVVLKVKDKMIDFETLDCGIYFLTVTTKAHNQTFRVIKQ